MAERELGEGEQAIRVGRASGDGTVQVGDRSLRIILKALCQVLATQDDLSGLADVSCGYHVGGQLTLHDTEVGELDLDRGRTSGE